MQRILIRNTARRQVHQLARRPPKRRVGVSQRRFLSISHALTRTTTPLLPRDRIRILQLRSFSSHEHIIHEIERLTAQVLNHSVTPLGTMSALLVDDTIASCQHLCKSKLGYEVESADQLLRRLMYEHASGSSAAQQQTTAIADLQLEILNAWLTLGSSRMALEKAQAVLMDMIQWYEEGISTHDPSENMASFMEACQPFPSVAANLLLLRTELPDSSTATELAPMFNNVLKSCIQENDTQTATLLVERMEMLEKKYEWENLQVDDDARKLIAEGLLAVPEEKEDSFSDDGKHLSSFELQAIQGRFLEFLKTASPDDKQKVLKMAEQLPTMPQSDVTDLLYKALIAYFCKIEDVKNATLLLSRIDAGLDQTNVVTEELFLGVLGLWVKSKEPDAPWRAQELVTRMEELESLGLLHVSVLTYNLLCESWARSSDPSASNKVDEIFSRMEQGDDSKAPNLETFKVYLSVWPKEDHSRVAQVVSKLLKQGEELGNKEFSNIVENSLAALAMDAPSATGKHLQERGTVASELLHQAVSQGINVTPTMCTNLLIPQQPEAALKELEYLESLPDVTIPLVCYARTIFAFFDARRPSFNQKKEMVARTLKRYADGKLAAESSDIESLMSSIMQELAYQGRPSPMDTMLKLFEEWTMIDDARIKDVKVPLECFNLTLNAWTAEGDAKKVEETFNRLVAYSGAGQASLQPNTASYSKVLQTLLASNSSPEEVAKKASLILENMLKLHESTGNDACKPNEPCFQHVLTALSKVGSADAAKYAVIYLKQMLSMDLQPSTIAFNKVMYAILNAPNAGYVQGGKYLRVWFLMKRMKEIGVEPDVLTYKNILRACSFAAQKDKPLALKLALETMGRLRTSGGADAGSYGLIAVAFQSLLKVVTLEDRDKIASAACRVCYQDGFLNKQNTELFRNAMSFPMWLQLTEEFSIKTKPTLSAFNKLMYGIVTAPKKTYETGEKYTRSRLIMEEMQKADVQPNKLTYKNILRACSFAGKDDKPAALNLALETMGRLRKSGEADAGSFGLLAIALDYCLRFEKREKRDKIASAACRLCYEDGFLNEQNRELYESAMSKYAWGQLAAQFSEIESKRQAADLTDVERITIT